MPDFSKFSQKQVAAFIGLSLALGLTLPTDLPQWNGTQQRDFNYFKNFFNQL